ncbi:MAG: hypothetical protein ACRD0A_17505 [Acidimicrobiales bacterium]
MTRPETQPSLPADRAFVIQFRAARSPEAVAAQGRAEHVVTGAATHFADWHELRAFVESVLASNERGNGR